MNAVGIDVSKGKSTVTIRRPGDVILMPPRDVPHTQSAITQLIHQIKDLDGETKVCMEGSPFIFGVSPFFPGVFSHFTSFPRRAPRFSGVFSLIVKILQIHQTGLKISC